MALEKIIRAPKIKIILGSLRRRSNRWVTLMFLKDIKRHLQVELKSPLERIARALTADTSLPIIPAKNRLCLPRRICISPSKEGEERGMTAEGWLTG